VLKVMFGAIVTAMVLMFTMIGLGILDYNLVWVNPTYLGSGIVGGLIMGVGFIIGGFCPGTSLAAMATGKIDGIFFVGGVLGGISSGQPITVRLAIKPTSSTRLDRRSIDREGRAVTLNTHGRHDPCVGLRATPIAEALLALVVMEHALRQRAQCADVPVPDGF